MSSDCVALYRPRLASSWLTFALVAVLAGCSDTNTVELRSSIPPIDTVCKSLSLTGQKPVSLYLAARKEEFLQRAQVLLEDLFSGDINAIIDPRSYVNRGGAEHVAVSFDAVGIPLCYHSARMHQIGEELWLNGSTPQGLSFDEDAVNPWLLEPPSIEAILDKLASDSQAEAIAQRKCLVEQNGRLVPAWHVSFRINNLLYKALASSEGILTAEPDHFQQTITATAVVFRKNPPNSTNIVLASIPLSGMSSGGSLCTKELVSQAPEQVIPAFSASGVFEFQSSSAQFFQTSLFANAKTQQNYILSLGLLSQWPGSRISIKVDPENNFLNNQAVYNPPTATSPPEILMGFGDNLQLKLLYYDDEPVSHELGHHLIFQTLNNVRRDQDSAILHEGLADFLTMARTNNPCLGEIICPAGSTLCVSTECLRRADSSLAVGDPDYNLLSFHKKSQAISGLLWDFGKAIGLENAAKLTLKSIDFYAADADFANFLEAVMKADQALNRGVNACTFQSAAEGRGMANILQNAGLDCKNFQN